MEHYPFLFINITLIVGCIALAVVFLTLPLPQTETLNKYRISLRFLAGGYITMAIVKVLVMVFNLSLVNIISLDTLMTASLQATLFVLSLIILINPRFVTKNYLYKQLAPVFVLTILYMIFCSIWGNVQIHSIAELIRYKFHPVIIIRELFLFYYIFQLFYLTRLFFRQAELFGSEMDNYFSECSSACLPWIKYSFYAAFSVGIGALLSCFMFADSWIFIFTVIYTLFYLGFGIYYIQYPSKFIYIEPAIYPQSSFADKASNNKKRLVWDELKNKIIDDKYYLKPGVNIEDMAQYLKIGRTTLSTFINNEEGMNFNLWITSLRIEEAKNLFANYPDYSLTQISELIGYSEPSNFSRQFKLITNESPSVWRQTCQLESANYRNN
ncbi:transcriptional regulator, AraC family [Paludibacter propionicigenes WB4]|uniref:Transcriptional regulator, AraC family n=2 Tax=Paludibacter TaxID=346096 RepID=E4T6C8_PALPW|nr:transcriptional regulator, AraC family [Paludibacter propionicigenes WB4]